MIGRSIRTYQEAELFLDGAREREIAKSTMLSRGSSDSIDIWYHTTRIVTHYKAGQTRVFPSVRSANMLMRLNHFTLYDFKVLESDIWEVFTPCDSARVEDGMMISIGGELQQHKKFWSDRRRFSNFLR